MTDRIIARPAPERPLEDLALDRELISRLVRRFYGKVAEDERLGPIFNRRLDGRWDTHLEKMTEFWSSVMMATGTYQGRPVPAHLRLKEVVPEDFAIWLGLFRETVEEMCSPPLAAAFMERAERIARSLQLAMFYRLPASPAAASQGAG